MAGNYEVGSVIEGKVTGIKPFGAFVALDEERQGLVHISEVSHGFVKDINEVLTVGEQVQVKILNIDEDSKKISLSIRATQPAPERQERPQQQMSRGQRRSNEGKQKEQGFNTLEDKLKEWLKQSNEIHADLNKRARK